MQPMISVESFKAIYYEQTQYSQMIITKSNLFIDNVLQITLDYIVFFYVDVLAILKGKFKIQCV